RGRVDLRSIADRPVDVLRAQGARARANARCTAPAARSRAQCRHPTHLGRELPGLRRAQGVAATEPRADRGRPLYRRASDARPRVKGVGHHSDHGSQYLSIRYSERLAEVGAEPSVGSVGDSYDNALAETIIGLYKTEVIHRRGPWRHLEAVEYATLEWVDWFNHRRLLEPIGNVPPAALEMSCFHTGTAEKAA